MKIRRECTLRISHVKRGSYIHIERVIRRNEINNLNGFIDICRHITDSARRGCHNISLRWMRTKNTLLLCWRRRRKRPRVLPLLTTRIREWTMDNVVLAMVAVPTLPKVDKTTVTLTRASWLPFTWSR